MSKAKLEVELKPFITPNFVIPLKLPSSGVDISFPLSDLDVDSLQILCQDFCVEVFKKAKKVGVTVNVQATQSD